MNPETSDKSKSLMGRILRHKYFFYIKHILLINTFTEVSAGPLLAVECLYSVAWVHLQK